MTPTISILLPVYNARKYLPACLQSILVQSFSDFELICVDDGSTDGSGSVLERFARQDGRIKFSTQENSGVAVARNRLVARARGEYIAFMDADDLLMPFALKTLLEGARQAPGCDIIQASFRFVPEDFVLEDTPAGPARSTPRILSRKVGSRLSYGYHNGLLWGKLIRRQWWLDKRIVLPEGSVTDDFYFGVLAALEASGIARIPAKIYLYRRNVSGSITASRQPQAILDKYACVLAWYREFRRRNLWNAQVADFWLRTLVRRMAGFFKLPPEERTRNGERLEEALSLVRRTRPECTSIGRAKWRLFLWGADRLSGKSFARWCKLFR